MLTQKKATVAVLFIFAFCALNGLAHGDQYAGQRLKVTGQWNGKHLNAIRVQPRDAKKDSSSGRVEGRIDKIDVEKGGLRIGPMLVKLTRDTKLDGVRKEDLQAGKSILAIGHLAAPAVLLASALEPASLSQNYIELLGVVSSGARNGDGKIHMKILGVPVLVPEEIYDPAFSLVRNPNDKRPDQQLAIPLFGKPLIIGGEISNSSNFRGDYKLEDDADDDQLRLENGAQLELFYRPAKRLLLFLRGKIGREAVVYAESNDRPVEREIERDETWLYAGDILGSGIGLQLGRQNFRERREWWWSQDLDALRLYYIRRGFNIELGLAQELGRVSTALSGIDPEEQDVLRVLGRASWENILGNRFDLFFLRQRDFSTRQQPGAFVDAQQEDPSDASLLWLGARLTGDLKSELAGDFEYWLDGAGVTGRETIFEYDEDDDDRQFVSDVQAREVRGWAFDGGISWATNFPLRPTLTMNYAIGSGSNSKKSTRDHNFRQTGLQENNNKFNGVDRFRYYGELLRPELSNLQIATASLGLRFLRSSSIELLYHRYRQQHAAPYLRGARLKADPEGKSPEIGEEWNLVIGLEEWQRLEIEIVGALFRAGKAYNSLAGKLAHNLILKVDFNF